MIPLIFGICCSVSIQEIERIKVGGGGGGGGTCRGLHFDKVVV